MRDLMEFKKYLIEEEKSCITVEKYCRDIKCFIMYCDNRPVTKLITVEYKKYLKDSGYAVRSVNSMLAALNSFLKFIGLSDCAVKSLKQQKESYCAESKELTKSEYMKLLSASEEKEQLNLVLQTICGTGIRVSELKYFTVESV